MVVTELPAGVHLDEFDQDHRIWLGTIASHLGTDTRNSGPVGEATLHAGTTGRVLAEPASCYESALAAANEHRPPKPYVKTLARCPCGRLLRRIPVARFDKTRPSRSGLPGADAIARNGVAPQTVT